MKCNQVFCAAISMCARADWRLVTCLFESLIRSDYCQGDSYQDCHCPRYPSLCSRILLMTFTLLHLLGVAVKGHFRQQQQQFWAIINIKSGPREQTKTSWNGQLSALLNTPAKYKNNRGLTLILLRAWSGTNTGAWDPWSPCRVGTGLNVRPLLFTAGAVRILWLNFYHFYSWIQEAVKSQIGIMMRWWNGWGRNNCQNLMSKHLNLHKILSTALID